jgi:hypothetical protein
MEGLTGWWALELDNIALGVGEIDRGTFSLGPIAHLDWAHLNAERLKMPADFGFIEWLDPQTEVIEISTLPSRGDATGLAQFSIDRHQIDDGPASAQLNEADLVLPPFHGATKRVAVEAKHAVEVDHAENEMINFADLDHVICVEGGQR